MRVVMLSKALVVGAYQKKAEELARLPDIQLTVVVPPFWQEGGRRQYLERAYTVGYDLRVLPMALNGHFHTHFYPGFGNLLRCIRPDIVHVDEEPYNLATAHATLAARQIGARVLFFTWQNIHRRIPPPFSLIESYSLRKADYGLAGNQEAVDVLRRKGYRGPVSVVPQFGVDPDLYHSGLNVVDEGVSGVSPFTIGYLGRFVEQKGLATLLEAASGLSADWRLNLVGSGPQRDALIAMAAALNIADRVVIGEPVPSTAVPAVLSGLHVLVLPSQTRPNWKEQFGRVLIEAMACGLPVVGSSSGEIPNVIGEAGLLFPEGDANALRDRLDQLRNDPTARRRLGALGRERVLAHYTQASVARQTYGVYQELVANARCD